MRKHQQPAIEKDKVLAIEEIQKPSVAISVILKRLYYTDLLFSIANRLPFYTTE